MAYVKEIGTAAATLVCAVGIGFIMQSSDTAKARYGASETPVAASATSLDGPVLEVDAITLTSALDTPVAPAAAPEPEPVRVSAPDVLDTPATGDVVPGLNCAITMTAAAAEMAHVDVSLSAPCLPFERVTLHHSGMMITQTTDRDGALQVNLPALTEQAVVIAAFTNGDGAVAQATVADLADYDRVVLQWKGKSGFEVHAREFGADYGAAGHVWHGAPGDMSAARDGLGGYMARLGDEAAPDPLMADIYTYPRRTSARSGTVDLSVEAEVTLYNCGLEVEAQSLEVMAGTIRTQDLTLAVSGCDTIGSFLVLNNLVQDLKVAAR
ncbi:MAG: hypothetical protein AAFY38_05000 [Pseudomonadota bacterium]